MSNYFSVDAAFWTDTDVVDDFTPEDKYFYLYLLTSPHGNVSGCYEVSLRQISLEMGYSVDTVERLLKRFTEVHKVIDYSKETKEILIHNWGKHHWTTSDKYIAALGKKISSIKNEVFKSYLEATLDKFIESRGRVWIPYQYGMDTTFLFFKDSIESLETVEGKEDSREVKNRDGGMGEEKGKGETEETSGGVAEEVDSILIGCSPELIRTVYDWLEYKKEKRQGYKDRGLHSLLKTVVKKAGEFGDTAVIGAIEESMGNGYQGILWDRLRKSSYGNKKSKSYMELYGGKIDERV